MVIFYLTHTHTCMHTQWGVFVSCVEWTVFVCTHTLGHQWKAAFGAAPQWVKRVMDNGLLPYCIILVTALYSDLCRILHSSWCLHCSWTTCSPGISLLPSAHTRALGGACRVASSVVCSTCGASHRAGSGSGCGGELSPVMCGVFGGECGLFNVFGGEGAWRDGR